jgi:hypothetical protein
MPTRSGKTATGAQRQSTEATPTTSKPAAAAGVLDVLTNNSAAIDPRVRGGSSKSSNKRGFNEIQDNSIQGEPVNGAADGSSGHILPQPATVTQTPNLMGMLPMNPFSHSNPTAAMMLLEAGLSMYPSFYSMQLQQAMLQQQQQQTQMHLQAQQSQVLPPSEGPHVAEMKQEPVNESSTQPIWDGAIKEKIYWSTDMVHYLIEQYAANLQRNTDSRPFNTSFSPISSGDVGLAHRAWRNIAKLLSEKFGNEITPKACKNKFAKLKYEFNIMKWIDRELKQIVQLYEAKNITITNPRETPEWEAKRQELSQQDAKLRRYLEPHYYFPFLEKMTEVLPESFASGEYWWIKAFIALKSSFLLFFVAPLAIEKPIDSSLPTPIAEDFVSGTSAIPFQDSNDADLLSPQYILKQHAKISGEIRSMLISFQESLKDTIANVESLLSSEEELLISPHLSPHSQLLSAITQAHSSTTSTESNPSKLIYHSSRAIALQKITSEERFKEFIQNYDDCKVLFQIFSEEEEAVDFLLFPDVHKVDYLRDLMEHEKSKLSPKQSSKV